MSLFEHFLTKNQALFETLDSLIGMSSNFRPSESAKAISREKSASRAAILRNLGNESYRLSRLADALNFYSESIANAPIDSEELALAFGNRSAVLFRLRKYELCLLDVNRALKGRLPEISKEKLLERQAKSWNRIQKENAVKLMCMKAREHLPPDELNPFERKFCYISELSIDDADPVIDYSSFDDPIWNSKFDNRSVPNFTSKMKYEYDSKSGRRRCIATDDIAPGEVLAIENLFSLKVYQKASHNHCGHCSVWCEALIPCHSCTLEMYCSERCRREAYDSYHRVECIVVPLFSVSEQQEVILLALRTFFIGTKQGSELTNLMNDPNVYDCLEGMWEDANVPQLENYLSVLNLIWRVNDNEFPSPVSMFAAYTIAGILFGALKHVNFFKNEKEPSSSRKGTDVELFAALLLLHHVILNHRYCSGIQAEYIADGPDPQSGDRVIGCSLGSFLRIMNHSCVGNTFVLGDKQRELLYSIRPIKAGEEIFTTLYVCYISKPRKERDDFLKEMFDVKCRCRACIENWPTKNELLKRKNVYLTSDKKILKKVKKMHEWLLYALKPTDMRSVYEFKEENLKKALEFNKDIRKYVKEPAPTIMLCEEFIRQSMEKKANCYTLQSTASMMDDLVSGKETIECKDFFGI